MTKEMMEKIREKAKRFFALSDVDSIQIIIFQPHFSKTHKTERCQLESKAGRWLSRCCTTDTKINAVFFPGPTYIDRVPYFH